MRFANRFLKNSVAALVLAIYVGGILLFAPSVMIGLYMMSPTAFAIALLVTLAIYLIVFNTVWKRAKRALEKLIYSKVTGGGR